jgi:hypothetical protein
MDIKFTIDENDFKDSLACNNIEDTEKNRAKVIKELEWRFIDSLKENVMWIAQYHDGSFKN